MQMSLQENAKDTDKARCASLECDENLKDETQLGIDIKIFTPEDNGTNNNIPSQANGKESNLAIINNDPTMEDEIPLDTSGMVYKEDKFHEIEIPIQIDDKSGVENNNQNSFHHESSIQMSDSNEAQALVNRKRLKLYIPNRKDESTRL